MYESRFALVFGTSKSAIVAHNVVLLTGLDVCCSFVLAYFVLKEVLKSQSWPESIFALTSLVLLERRLSRFCQCTINFACYLPNSSSPLCPFLVLDKVVDGFCPRAGLFNHS